MVLQENTIYCGDNLEVLKGFEDSCVNLFYGDPQFFTQRRCETFWGDAQEQRMFEDVWVRQGDGRYTKDINVYLNFMEPRLREVYRVLKPSGSFYLHCDYHADSYLRVLCDSIFGYDNLVNHIVWKRFTSVSSSTRRYSTATDSVLFYSKSNEYVFNPERKMPVEMERKFNMIENETGRKFTTNKLIKSGRTNHTLKFGDRIFTLSDDQRFVISQERLDDEIRRNPLCIYWTSNDVPRIKMYMDEYQGMQVTSLWDDVAPLANSSGERLGYPTQKPEALLERVIKASSNEGDLVLDAWAGCGTALAVAKRLGRKFVAIDISPTACRLIASRIGYPLNGIIGLPMTGEEISTLTGYEFQNAMIRLLDPTLDTIKIGGKGADGGMDGTYHDIFISVKKFKAGRNKLDEFVGALNRSKKKKAMFIALDFTSDFLKEKARLEREDGIVIYPFTVADIVDGKHREILSDENTSHGKLV